MPWTTEQDETLRELIAKGATYSVVAASINSKHQTSYSRSACIGRAKRTAASKLAPVKVIPESTNRTRHQIKADKRKAKRWAANPSLAFRAQRIEERKQYRVSMVVRGFSKTSPGYRKQLPRIGDMTKTELRSMLSTAVQNTANLGVFR
jgi:hypothetical protein